MTPRKVLVLFVSLFAPCLLSQPVMVGYSSCYGDYQSRLSSNSVYSGLGSFMTGEDFTYTTAMCGDWQAKATGACFSVKCTSGKTGGSSCKTTTPSVVRVIDSLGGSCGTSNGSHIFDLNKVPFDQLATDGSSCSGEFYISYQAVACNSAAGNNLVQGGIRIGIAPNQCDPWCPPWWIDNVGLGGAVFGIQVSPDGGNTWIDYVRNSGNGARWDCANIGASGGKFLNKSLSFKITSCDITGLPSACNAGPQITLINALPTNWCQNGASPCTATSWQTSSNFASSGGTTTTTTTTTSGPTTTKATTTSGPTTTPAPATTTTAPGVSVSCPAITGTSYSAGATSNTIAKGPNFPTTISGCASTTLNVPVDFGYVATNNGYLVVDVGLSVSPWSWYGGGKCSITKGAKGIANVSVSITQGPVASPVQISMWLVDKAPLDADSSTAYQSATNPPGQVGVALTILPCGATTTTSAPATTTTTSAPATTTTTKAPTTTSAPATTTTTSAPATTTTKAPTTTSAPATTTTTKAPTTTTNAPTTTTTKAPTTTTPAPTSTPTSTHAPGGVYGNWLDGRSTYYDGIDAGNCGYKTIPSSTFPKRYVAAPNEAFYNKGAACGQCYEVRCVGAWDKTQKNPCLNKTTPIIKITDNCPKSTNTQWCSGDIVHFDLSTEAFNVLAPASIGVIRMQYRRVACPYTTPIRVVQTTGVSVWWIKFWLWDVANYGAITKVELQNSKSTTWWTMTQPDGDGGWALSAPSQYVVPLSIRITDSNGAQIVATGVITTIGDNTVSSFSSSAANYALPAGTRMSAETSEPENNFLKQGIYILVGVLVIVILIVALFLVLRSKARARGATMSEYVRKSIAPAKQEEITLQTVPETAVASQSDLSPVTPPGPEFEQLQPSSPLTPMAAATSTPEWEQRTDATSGQPYFYNNVSGVTQWEAPEGFQSA